MKKVICVFLIAVMLASLITLSACSDDATSSIGDAESPLSSESTEPSPPEISIATEPPQSSSGALPGASSAGQPTGEKPLAYDEIINRYKPEEMAGIFPDYKTESNIHLVTQWVSDYEQGIPSALPVYWFGIAGPSILIIESHGNKEYTIDIYNPDGTTDHYKSNYIIEREYDYVFGADFPPDVHPIPIQKKGGVVQTYEWDGETALDSLTPDEAIAKAEDIITDVIAFSRYMRGIRGNGVYMSESIMAAAPPYEEQRNYVIREARERNGELFYVIDNFENEMDKVGEPIAVSADGVNAFLISIVDGRWIYCYNENEKMIVPYLE